MYQDQGPGFDFANAIQLTCVLMQGMATNMLLGKQSKPGHQSGGGGLGGIAGSLLGGGSSGSHGGSHGGGGGTGALVGKLAGGLLGGGSKPHNAAGHGTSGAHQQSGLMGLAGGILGGSHGSVRRSIPIALSIGL